MKFAVSVVDAMSGVSANLPFRAVADDTHTEYALTADGAAFSSEVVLPSYVGVAFQSKA